MKRLIGRHINGYTLDKLLRQNGIQAYFQATHRQKIEPLCVKVLRLDQETLVNSHFKQQFNAHMHNLSRVRHPRILSILDSGITDEVCYVVTPLVDTVTLADVMEDGALSVERSLAIFTQIADCIADLHREGIVHGALSPYSIHFDENDRVLVDDLGIMIHYAQHSAPVTTITGNYGYIAPESLHNNATPTPAVDIYGLGILLYIMLTGEAITTNITKLSADVLFQPHIQPLPEQVNTSNTQQWLNTIIMQAIDADPLKRPESVDVMQDALANHISATMPMIREKSSFPREAQPILGAGIILMVAMLAILTGVTFSTQADDDINIAENSSTILLGEQVSLDTIRLTPADTANMIAQLESTDFIAYIACNRTSEYHATLAREIVDVGREHSVSIHIYDSDSDGYRQLIQIEQAKSDGALGIIICILDLNLVDDTLRTFFAEGYPIVTLGENNFGAVTIQTNNTDIGYPVGEAAGEYINTYLNGEARVVVLGYPALPDLLERSSALVRGMRDVAPDARVISFATGAIAENGYASVADLLNNNADFDVILSINDSGTYGAIEALEEVNIAPDEVAIFSVDAELQAREYIADGFYLRASIEVGRPNIAAGSVDAMLNLLMGNTMPQLINVPPGDIITTPDESVEQGEIVPQ